MARKVYASEDFFRELEVLTNDLRELIETECPAFAPGAGAKQKRIDQALSDHAFFARTYFPHYIQSEPSEFHSFASRRLGEIIRSDEGCNDAWAAPRGEAKSTLVTQITPIWLAVRDFYLLGGKSPYKIIPIIMEEMADRFFIKDVTKFTNVNTTSGLTLAYHPGDAPSPINRITYLGIVAYIWL